MASFTNEYKNNASAKKEIDAIVEAASKGDKEALSELCNRISKDVLYMSTFILGRSEGAEDIAQEVMYDVCKYIHSLKRPKAFRKWLSTIIVNRKNEFLREQQKRELNVEISEYIEESLMEERNEFVPVASLENRELMHVVKNLISELPDRQREIVALRYYEELKITEIAKIMNISFQCVSQQLSIANKKIQKGIDEYRHISGESKAGMAVPVGLAIAGTMQQDAMAFGIANEPIIQGLAINCVELIYAESAVVIATAVTAARQTATLVIAFISSVCIATMFTLAPSLLESRYTEYIHTLPSPEPVSIVFHGGTSVDVGLAHLNPDTVSVISDDMDVVSWWITPADSDIVLLEGEGYDSDRTLSQLRERGENGEFIIYFNLIDEYGRIHKQGINFYLG